MRTLFPIVTEYIGTTFIFCPRSHSYLLTSVVIIATTRILHVLSFPIATRAYSSGNECILQRILILERRERRKKC
jgi:hypothetical protein